MSCLKSSSETTLTASDPKTGRVLGIDFGLRRVGLAISDPLRIYARRLMTLERQRDDGPGPLEAVADLCAQEGVDTIVVGLPHRTDGRHSEIADLASDFARALEQATGCRVELFDERYTSLLASRLIMETSRKKKRTDKSLVDRVAAEILLQDFLDNERGGLTAGPYGS